MQILTGIPISQTMSEGAETTLYAALSSELDRASGLYLEDSAIKQPSRYAQDESEQERLWKLTRGLLRRYSDPNCEELWISTKIMNGEKSDLAEWHNIDKPLRRRQTAGHKQDLRIDTDPSSSLEVSPAIIKFLLKGA